VPNWFSRPFSGGVYWPSNKPWWKCNPVSDNEQGDIKEIWDLSRFNWVLAMSQRAANGDDDELDRLNRWLSDWVDKNPPYIGPNWGCGQEASIRVMHLAVAATILEQDHAPSLAVISFIKAHLERIESTLSYALAQDNNHGILEAAGLFIAGEWLFSATDDPRARKWANLGRKWLEERAQKLISGDGSFSMYSVSYHREFLDALIICEFWRRRYRLEDFSEAYKERAEKAALWLKAFTNTSSGDAPNIGANDGTRLLPLVDTNHRDFRPSVQAACVLFLGKRAYAEGPWDLPLDWLAISLPKDILPHDESRLFDNGGFAVLRCGESGIGIEVFVRYPRFRFRPAHPDLLHLDLWVNGVNILSDSGTFSYNANAKLANYFCGTESHNTIQFDDDDQMPRLGRFLLSNWPNDSRIIFNTQKRGQVEFSAHYSDYKERIHKRSLVLTESTLRVIDSVSGFSKKAVLIWRLDRADWVLEKCGDAIFIFCEKAFGIKKFSIRISSDVEIVRAEIKKGLRSRHYFQKDSISVLEVEISQSGELFSELEWIQ
jgi:hypothetical protein